MVNKHLNEFFNINIQIKKTLCKVNLNKNYKENLFTLTTLLLCYIPFKDHLGIRKGHSSSRVHSPGQPVYGGIQLLNIYIYMDAKDKSRRDCSKKQTLTWKKLQRIQYFSAKFDVSTNRNVDLINKHCSQLFFLPPYPATKQTWTTLYLNEPTWTYWYTRTF